MEVGIGPLISFCKRILVKSHTNHPSKNNTNKDKTVVPSWLQSTPVHFSLQGSPFIQWVLLSHAGPSVARYKSIRAKEILNTKKAIFQRLPEHSFTSNNPPVQESIKLDGLTRRSITTTPSTFIFHSSTLTSCVHALPPVRWFASPHQTQRSRILAPLPLCSILALILNGPYFLNTIAFPGKNT